MTKLNACLYQPIERMKNSCRIKYFVQAVVEENSVSNLIFPNNKTENGNGEWTKETSTRP